MTRAQGILPVVFLLSVLPWEGARAQPPSTTVLLEGRFHSPMSYEEVLARLDDFYREQAGKSRAEALPEIGPRQHFDNWRDMWMEVTPSASGSHVVLRRAAEAASLRAAKSSMLDIAGRLSSGAPIDFEQVGTLETVSTEICIGRRDVAEELQKAPSEPRPIPSWRQAGLFVAFEPLALVTLDNSGLTAASRLAVTMRNPAEARKLLARLAAGAGRPGICAVLAEATAIDEEVRRAADRMERDTMIKSSGLVLSMGTGTKAYEDRVRSAPEMQKRIADARGSVQVKYRLDRPYRSLTLRWFRLADIPRAGGEPDTETAPAGITVQNPRKTEPGEPATARFKPDSLEPGAYRIRIDAAQPSGEQVRVDERTFWFDGKRFREI
jgi:hypothetical protein